MNHRPYCMVCGDDLIHVSDGNGEPWLVHAHMKNDDHTVVPAYDDEKVPFTMVDLWLGVTVAVMGVCWFLTR